MSDNRRLGDEWLQWDGESQPAEINENKLTFILLSLAAGLGYVGLVVLFWYLSTPRFVQFGRVFYIGSFIVFALLTGLGALFVLSFLLSLIFKKPFYPNKHSKRFFYQYVLDAAIKLGSLFGISRDRIGNSFVKVNNEITTGREEKHDPEDVLILLPRCLRKEVRKKTLETIEDYGCKVQTATGGESARREVLKQNPSLVIGVACERDLMTGIQDTVSKVPALGIPNKRPEGPCVNTVIDIEKLEKQLEAVCRT